MSAMLNEVARKRYAAAKEAADKDPILQALKRLPGYRTLEAANLQQPDERDRTDRKDPSKR